MGAGDARVSFWLVPGVNSEALATRGLCSPTCSVELPMFSESLSSPALSRPLEPMK